MVDDEFIGSIEFTLSTSLKPWNGDPDDYWVEANGNIVVCPNDDSELDSEKIAGRVEVVTFKLMEARNDDVSVFEVFDAYSDLTQIYRALFTENGDLRTARRNTILSDVVFIQSLVIDAEFHRSQLLSQVVESIISTFGSAGVTVAFKEMLTLVGSEWHKMGFIETADSDIVFRNEAMGQ